MIEQDGTFEKVQLFKERLSQLIYLSGDVVNDLQIDISTYAKFYTDQYILRMRDFVWAEHLETQEIVCPIDWKEAFRERWFPKWWLDRYPIQYTRKVIEAKALYPKLRMAGQNPVIQIRQRSHEI